MNDCYFRRLKVTMLLLMLCIIQLAAQTEMQRVSVNLKNVSLTELFSTIEKQTTYRFSYRDIVIDQKKNVTVAKNDVPVSIVLESVLPDKGLIYSVVSEKSIVISEKKNQLKPVAKAGVKQISGIVTDQSRQPVIGVNVVEKGTTNGVVTDLDGKYVIDIPENATLAFSYIGFMNQEIRVGKAPVVNILLHEDTQALDEVVVVGFGSQKKVNLTGSVSSVSAKDLAERPQPNVQNMLQGKVAGMQIVTNSGQPGRDSGAISIRGKGSFGASANPLVLIDGVVGELSALAPDDIESISVLKDASSASIYGARAANGVILVTTKKGQSGKAQVTYSFNYGWQQATKLGDQIWDSATYMEMFNQMADRMGGRTKYSNEMIGKYKDTNRNRNLYPDYNWMEETFSTGYNMTHNIGVNGGSDKVTYNVSLGYLDQEGILANHNYKKYTGLMNLEAQVHDRIKIGATSSFYNGKVNEPYYTNQALILMINSSRPMTKPYLPDGSGRYSYESFPESYGGEWENRNPVWAMNETSREIENWIANGQIYFDVDFIKKDKMKLIWNTKAGFRYADQFQKTHYPASPQGFYYLPESEYKPGGNTEHMLATDFFPEKGVSTIPKDYFIPCFILR